MNNKRPGYILLTAGLLLSIPFIAMLFTDEVRWTSADFAVMGGLLFGTGLLVEISLRLVKKTWQRVTLCGVVVAAFLLVWMELAVGIFGSPFAGS